MKKIQLLIALIAVMSATLQTSADTRTTRKKLKRIPETIDTLYNADNDINPCIVCDSLIFDSYDKPLRSTKETFFIENRSRGTVRSVTVTIVYCRTDDTMLHSRVITIPCDIPPGERRQLSTPSWDIQLAYYYMDTRITPRSKKAIPFKINATVTHAVIAQDSSINKI